MMEREQIVAEFFKRGHLLTEEALKIIEEKGTQALSGSLPLVVGTKDFQQPYRIAKNLTHTKTEISSEDFVSLKKIDSGRNEVYVIGIVKEIKEKDGKTVVDVEDQTASMPIIFEKDDIDDAELDDVVAIKAVTGGR